MVGKFLEVCEEFLAAVEPSDILPDLKPMREVVAAFHRAYPPQTIAIRSARIGGHLPEQNTPDPRSLTGPDEQG